MIILIDNYDSFTYNLVQCIGELGSQVKIIRNDEMHVQQILDLKPRAIIISPGPGSPKDAGISLNTIEILASNIPILGVCLGHQSIGHLFGCKIIRATVPVHGKTSLIYHDSKDLFAAISNPLVATRYHSLVIDNHYLPRDLIITAWTDQGIVMGCKHKKYPLVYGIQFHPESLWTDKGKIIIHNFLNSK